MSTLVAALTLVALLKMAHVEMPRWHLAFAFATLVALASRGSMPLAHLAVNVLGSFGAAWLYFEWLDRTDNRPDRALHWLILVGGFVLLIGSRLWLDIRVYRIGL
jgi:hypothetical protein